MAQPTPSDLTAYRRSFGHQLQALRAERGISQEALAHGCGVARSYLSGIERGLKGPGLDVIVRLAAGLGVQPGDLLPDLPRRTRRTHG